jgi:predicted nucleic acid-binding protein
MVYLFDSNVFIFQLNGVLGDKGRALLRTGLLEGGAYSVISRIEVLGYPQSTDELAAAEELFQGLTPISVDDAVIAQTIRLRQMRKIKIPDAIIAASALIQGLPLVTNNVSDFQWIKGLRLIDPLPETTV